MTTRTGVDGASASSKAAARKMARNTVSSRISPFSRSSAAEIISSSLGPWAGTPLTNALNSAGSGAAKVTSLANAQRRCKWSSKMVSI